MAIQPTAVVSQNKSNNTVGSVSSSVGVFPALAAILSLVMAGTHLARAADSEALYEFNIANTSLSQAVRDYGQIVGQEIIFTEDLVAGRRAPSIKGRLTAAEALEQLLKDTGLTTERSPSGALMIRRAQSRAGASTALISAGGVVAAQSDQALGGAAQKGQVDTALEEVVVTAQRREELSRDVPITITSLGAEQIEQAGIVQLSDIARLTPGLRFDSVTNFVQPTIRGIGTAVNAAGGGANVGIYVDGFYSPNPVTSNFDLVKVQNIQVLKGPQGTLFGRNTTGGAVLVTTAEPSTQTSGMAEASYGRFNAQRYRGYLTTGLTNAIAVDLEGQYRTSDGYTTNIVDGNDEIGHSKNWSVRTGLKVDLSEDLSVLLRYSHADIDNPSDGMSNPFVTPNGEVLVFSGLLGSGLYATDPDHVGRSPSQAIGFTSQSDTLQMTVTGDLGFANLVSYTQYRDDDSSMFNDFDFTAADVFLANLKIKNKTVSQELLLTSKEGGKLQWTAGAFYFQSKEQWDFGSASVLPVVPILANGTNTHSYAAYADLTYEMTPQLFVTAGARYSHDTVTDAWFTSTNPLVFGQRFEIPDYDSDRMTPRVVVRYKPSERSSAYVSFTRGYKAGILNVGGEQFEPVKPESVSAYEVGYKYEDRAVSFDVATFYYDYKDLQVSTYFGTTAMIDNAASSRIYGLDMQARYRFANGFEVNAGGAYTKSEYRNFDGSATYIYCDVTEPCAGFFKVVPVDITKGDMQRAPDFTANIGARYPIGLAGGQLTLAANLYYTSKFFFDPSEQFAQKAYEVLALRAEWTDPSDRYTVAVFGDNVTDSRYRTQLLTTNLGIGGSWNTPATYGLSLGVKF